MTPRWKSILLATTLAVGALGFAVLTRAQFTASVNALHLNLRQPDVLVRSARLSDLPKDLVNAPMLKGILTDDVVHYYESHPTRLSLVGTLKRLAYDHQLSWSDRLVSTLMDAPAELSLWRDDKGRPDHFMLVLQQNLATQLLQNLAKVALPDSQLTVAGEVDAPGGAAVVYVLRFNHDHAWLIVGAGERLVVLSEPGMLLEDGGSLARDARQAVSEALRAPAQGLSAQAQALGLGPLQGLKQDISARADYLSFGYQTFFPGLDAARVVLRQGGDWQLSARLTPEALSAWQEGSRRLWQAVPAGHALCVALPMNWATGSQVLKSVSKKETQQWLTQLDPVAGLCWNKGGGLDAPMLAARLRHAATAADDRTVATLLADVTRKKAGANAGVPAGTPVAAVSTKALPAGADGRTWLRKVPHANGNVQDGQASIHRVSAVRLGQTLMAAVDEDSLGQALAVARRSYPAMADQFKDADVPVLAVDSALLAQLLEIETWQVLNPSATPTFHRVARQLLPARLKALREQGRWQVVLPATARVTPAGGEGPGAKAGWVDLNVRTAR